MEDEAATFITKPLVGDFESIYSIAFIAMFEKNKKQNKFDLDDIFFKSSVVFFVQMTIIYFVLVSSLHNEDGLEWVKPDF